MSKINILIDTIVADFGYLLYQISSFFHIFPIIIRQKVSFLNLIDVFHLFRIIIRHKVFILKFNICFSYISYYQKTLSFILKV